MCGNGPDGEDLGEANVEDSVLFVVGDAVDLCGDAWRHDLVPSVYALDQVTGMCRGAGAAEGMSKGGIWRKVLVDGGQLEGWRSLGQEGDHVGDLGDRVVHLEKLMEKTKVMMAVSKLRLQGVEVDFHMLD